MINAPAAPETRMTTLRTLNEIASTLEDVSVTLEEIKSGRNDMSQLDGVQSDVERAVDMIDESVNTTQQPGVL
jgi:hypothetical protein